MKSFRSLALFSISTNLFSVSSLLSWSKNSWGSNASKFLKLVSIGIIWVKEIAPSRPASRQIRVNLFIRIPFFSWFGCFLPCFKCVRFLFFVKLKVYLPSGKASEVDIVDMLSESDSGCKKRLGRGRENRWPSRVCTVVVLFCFFTTAEQACSKFCRAADPSFDCFAEVLNLFGAFCFGGVGVEVENFVYQSADSTQGEE